MLVFFLLHGVGVSVVNALSSHLKMIIYKDGSVYEQEFREGIPPTELKVIGEFALIYF